VLERLATQAAQSVGFPVVVSDLRCSVNGTVLRSFDYEWYPTPEYAQRPSALTCAIADALAVLQEHGEA
jgi:hypothetical protein